MGGRSNIRGRIFMCVVGTPRGSIPTGPSGFCLSKVLRKYGSGRVPARSIVRTMGHAERRMGGRGGQCTEWGMPREGRLLQCLVWGVCLW